jgi:hypothetical protein
LNITVPPDTANWLKTQGNASATIKALVDAHIGAAGAASADALDAARYRAIRRERVGSDGPCEIWNVAYVGRQLDAAVDAVIAAAAAGHTWNCPHCSAINRNDLDRISCGGCGKPRSNKTKPGSAKSKVK